MRDVLRIQRWLGRGQRGKGWNDRKPTVNVNTEDAGTVVCEKGTERSTDDLGAVDDRDHFSVQPISAILQDIRGYSPTRTISIREQFVVNADKLEHLDDRERCTRQHRLDGSGRWDIILDGLCRCRKMGFRYGG